MAVSGESFPTAFFTGANSSSRIPLKRPISGSKENASNKKDSNLYAFGVSGVITFPSSSVYVAFLWAL